MTNVLIRKKQEEHEGEGRGGGAGTKEEEQGMTTTWDREVMKRKVA
jgi:hypothetical protein